MYQWDCQQEIKGSLSFNVVQLLWTGFEIWVFLCERENLYFCLWEPKPDLNTTQEAIDDNLVGKQTNRKSLNQAGLMEIPHISLAWLNKYFTYNIWCLHQAKYT